MLTIDINPLLLEYALPGAAVGLLLGLLIMWLISRAAKKRLQADIAAIERDLKTQEALQSEREAAFELANAKLTQAFSEISNRSLRMNSDTFLKLAAQNLETQQTKAKHEFSEREKAVEAMVKPIRDALDASQKQIAELEKARSEAYGGIKHQLEAMQLSQKSLTQETQNLVNALRRPEVRGRWGEITLRRLVELAGMVEHCDFVEQVHTESDGQIIRPDMVVHMPDDRELVVDVKTPLDGYLAAAEAPDDAQRQLGLERHAKNLRGHIRMLSTKTYWEQFENSPEFVILFIPGDQFPERGTERRARPHRVRLVPPDNPGDTNKLSWHCLKAVAYGWRQLALADNAKEIRVLAEDLYGRLATFVYAYE